MAEEKKATKKSKVVAEETKEKESVIAEKKEETGTLWNAIKNTDGSRLLGILMIVMFLTWWCYDVVTSTGSGGFAVIKEVVAAMFLVLLFCAFLVIIIDSIILNVHSLPEKMKRDQSGRFNNKEKEYLDKITEEEDKEKRKILEQELLVLRQEYESRITDNLQKKDGKFTTDWREVLLVARKRLLEEEQRLRVRNVVNLVIGIISLLLGFIVLVLFLSLNKELGANSNFIDFLAVYWARIGFVITIGVIAGFFLRLYNLTEQAIAKNKNEITNIELRLTAGLMLCDTKDKANLTSLADDLAKDERNFVLKKNETSAITDIDKADIDRAVEIAIKAIKATK